MQVVQLCVQLTAGIRGDMAGLIGLRYRDPDVGVTTWSPHNPNVRLVIILNVSLVQDLRNEAYACVGKLRKESGPWLVVLKK